MITNKELLEAVRAENENTELTPEVKNKLLAALENFDRQRINLLDKGADEETSIKLGIVGVLILMFDMSSK